MPLSPLLVSIKRQIITLIDETMRPLIAHRAIVAYQAENVDPYQITTAQHEWSRRNLNIAQSDVRCKCNICVCCVCRAYLYNFFVGFIIRNGI